MKIQSRYFRLPCQRLSTDPSPRARRRETPLEPPSREPLEAPVDVGPGRVLRCRGRLDAGLTGPRTFPPEDGRERGRGLCRRSRSLFPTCREACPRRRRERTSSGVSPADSPCRGGPRRCVPGSPRRAPRRDGGGRRRKGPKGARPSLPRRGRRSGGHLRGSGGRGSR